jgi:hypothetical protein
VALVVGIHGIGQRRTGADRLREVWLDAVSAGLDAAERPSLQADRFGLAYYADTIRKPWPFLGQDDTLGSEPIEGDEARWVEAALAELTANASSDNDRSAEELGLPAAPAWLIRQSAVVDRLFGRHAGRMATRMLREVYAYLYRDNLGAAIRDKVRASINPDTKVLMGHSLGSVVAYDMLRRGTITGKALITIGSPLGWHSVRAALGGSLDGKVVSAWSNIYDPCDVVTAGRGLAGFSVDIHDEPVDNGWQDAHAAVRYLSKAGTGRVLASSISRCAAA